MTKTRAEREIATLRRETHDAIKQLESRTDLKNGHVEILVEHLLDDSGIYRARVTALDWTEKGPQFVLTEAVQFDKNLRQWRPSQILEGDLELIASVREGSTISKPLDVGGKILIAIINQKWPSIQLLLYPVGTTPSEKPWFEMGNTET